jgi:outer membrane protein assembly factor BamB
MRRILIALALASIPAAAPADTPRVLWETRPVRAPAVAPALSGDTLWVAGSERRLVSMNARTGERHWRRTLPASASVSPVAASDRLLVGVGELQPALVAIDRHRGRTLWSRRLAAMPVAVLVRDSLSIAVGADGKVEAFRLEDGAPRWTQETGHRLAGAALSGSCICVIARADSIWLLDADSGRRRAARRISGMRSAPPTSAGDRFFCPRYDGVLLAFDAGTGEVTDSVAAPAPQIARVSVHGDRLVAVATGGEVSCYRIPGLIEEWSRATGETVSTGALAWNEGWVVLTEKGRVLGLTGDRGQIAWSLQFSSPITTPAVCSDRLLAIVDNRGRVVVHAIDGTP